MQRIAILATILFSFFACPAQVLSEYEKAIIYIDTNPVAEIEGIWQWTDSGTLVVIKANRADNSFIFKEIPSPLLPPETAGEGKVSKLLRTPKADTYILKTKGSRDRKVTMTSDGEGLMISGKSPWHIRFNPFGFIPYLNKMLYLRMIPDKSDEGLNGLLRVYPSYDGNGSSRRVPRYL